MGMRSVYALSSYAGQVIVWIGRRKLYLDLSGVWACGREESNLHGVAPTGT
jgi:hypothetical protein